MGNFLLTVNLSVIFFLYLFFTIIFQFLLLYILIIMEQQLKTDGSLFIYFFIVIYKVKK